MAALVDLAACLQVFRIRAPFLGDKGEYLEFLDFMPRAFIGIWIAGRISAILVTLRWPGKSLGYALVFLATVTLFAGWSILGETGWIARGIGEFSGWQGLGSAADILGLHLEPGWEPSWTRRVVGRHLFAEIGLHAGLFWLACFWTRRALQGRISR